MKKCVFTFVLIILCMNAMAGSFIVNFLVVNESKENVEIFLETVRKKTIGIYSDSSPRMYLICDKEADEQDTGYGYAWGKEISLKIKSPILYTLIHDSDILIFALFNNGELVFEYDSWPGYWDGAAQKPVFSGKEEAATIFGVDEKKFSESLGSSDNADEYVFAEDILEKVRILLSIPEYIYFGYEYAKSDYSLLANNGFIIKEWK